MYIKCDSGASATKTICTFGVTAGAAATGTVCKLGVTAEAAATGTVFLCNIK